MAAEKGNQWWRLRASSGVSKTFENKDTLWASCVEYFEATDKRKWKKTEYIGKNREKKVEIPTDTPYTLSGLCIFLGITTDTWRNYRSKEGYEDFFGVVNQVDEIIYTQKFEGATVGAFNANIIARDLGLIDRKDIKTDDESFNKFEYNIVRNKVDDDESEE